MKGRGKEGGAEGPLLFPLLVHSPCLSLFCCVAIATSCYQFTFVRKKKKIVLIRLREGEGEQKPKQSADFTF